VGEVEDLASDMANVLARAGAKLVEQRRKIVDLIDQLEAERRLTQHATDARAAALRELDHTQRALSERTAERDHLGNMLADMTEEKEMAEAYAFELQAKLRGQDYP